MSEEQRSGAGERSRGAEVQKMIRLETARKLKAAGLHWEPAQGDRFAVPERGWTTGCLSSTIWPRSSR